MIDKGRCILAYMVGWIGAIVVLFGMKNNSKEDIIIAGQALIIHVGYRLLSMVAIVITFFLQHDITLILALLYLVLVIVGLSLGLSGNNYKLPIIGDWAYQLFSKQIGIDTDGKHDVEMNYDPYTGEKIK